MNHRYIVVGVDGTGSPSWMKKDGSNSHVYKFVEDFQYGSIGIDRLFLHGPSNQILGRDTEPITQRAVDFIYHRLAALFPGVVTNKIKPLTMYDMNSCMQEDALKQQNRYVFLDHPVPVPQRVTKTMLLNQKLSTDDVRIVLVGHSRGGVAVTTIARMLSPVIRVYWLGLYDSVDRQPCLDSMNVENVKFVIHARRNPEVGSRTYFKNTSLNYIGVDDKEEEFFHTSHGGVGGDFVTSAEAAGFTGDHSCIPTTTVKTRDHGTFTYANNPKLVNKMGGKLMDEICADGSRQANVFIRAQARRFGLPIN